MLKTSIRQKNILPSFLHEALIGICLGDGHLEKSGLETSNARLTITFAAKYILLARYIWGLFIFYIDPKGLKVYEVQSGVGSKFYDRVIVRTVALPIFTIYHNLFYSLINNKYVKIIPLNIEELLTPVSLAFFIMGDGNYNQVKKVIRLYTNSYSKSEVELISKALSNKFKILNRLEKAGNNYIIIVPTSQVPKLQDLVKEHIHPSFLYRIGLPSTETI